MADVVSIDQVREKARHIEEARRIRAGMQDLYDTTPEAERDGEFRQSIVMLWRLMLAELEAAG